MRFDLLTLFPAIFESYLRQSLLKRAIDSGRVNVKTWDIRDWTTDPRRSVDDKPYGGGPGMLICPQPVFDCVEAVQAETNDPGELILLSPQGQRLDQGLVNKLAESPRLILLCGRYEGFDERVRIGLKPREVSAGDFVTNGGEVPAMVLIDAVIRMIPGVLGDETSNQSDSFADGRTLEYPQYTRPREFRGMTVPEVLLSGDHEAIDRWRAEQSRQKTANRHNKHRQD